MSDSPDEVILDVRAIKKSYMLRTETIKVLKGVDLALSVGEILSVVGPSGVGKSTLLHILGALDRPDEGNVLVNGTDVFTLGNGEIARFRNTTFGFVFQFHYLLPELTAIENVMMPCLIAGMSAADASARASQVLAEEVGLKGRLDHRPRELSGGEPQRVAVARALVMRPSVVLADEPSGNLDVECSEALHDLLFALRRRHGQSFIIATHNLDLAGKADRVLKLFDGVVEEVKI